MIQAPKGTRDVYGVEMQLWRHVEDLIREITTAYRYQEIRTPIFEPTELFLRGVGETTDIVQKEMYTFLDKGGRSMTLRPEGTAGVARSYIERGIASTPQPTKQWYLGPIFRYEQPQAGRYRQHFQFGVEVFGGTSAATEAEVISLGWTLLNRLGVRDVTLHLNSIGCPGCRKLYHEALRAFIDAKMDSLCGLCRQRIEKNPLRVLDCKTPSCKEHLKDAPSVLDSLDEECAGHFQGLQQLLKTFEIPFVIDPRVVRGLDYYTRTVFEFITAEGLTVLGGGRYDGLIEQVGGQHTPGVGFGMGMERLVNMLQAQQFQPTETLSPQIFIGHADEAGERKAQELVYFLRQAGVKAEGDLLNRSVKAQMKYASKINAAHTMIIGGNELENASANVKNMETGEAEPVQFDNLLKFLETKAVV
ncbi:MAG: histidine--tRNA ligase [Defluviitaleaceae bacterium]|nr:histidine--tRNA ligase [Defluviitaleaceae bacterium]